MAKKNDNFSKEKAKKLTPKASSSGARVNSGSSSSSSSSKGGSKKSKSKKIQVSGYAKNLKKMLEKDLKVKKTPKDYDQVKAKQRKGKKLKIKSKAKKRPLEQIRKDLQPLQRQAMDRLKELKEAGVLNKSMAYQSALASKPTTKKSRRWLFDLNDAKTFKDLQREAGRIQAFLTDESSTVEGALWTFNEMRLIEAYGGAFGNQWKASTGGTYDPSRVDSEYLKTAGKIWRMMEDVKGAYGLLYDEGSYESESTFMSIYDMVVQRDIRLDEDGKFASNSDEDRGIQTMFDILQKLKEYNAKYTEEAMLERTMGNMDSRPLVIMKNAETYRDFLNKMHPI
ncbi:MAG: hypothetical protein J6Q39_07130 [Bacteroidales bacterium]|nr:hypothetical protein [Bacteroidales bacterium]